MTRLFDGLPDVFTHVFGQAVTLLTAYGTAEVQGILQTRPVDALGVSLPGARLHLSVADAADVGEADKVIVGEAWFTVRGAPELDGKGMAILYLEKDE